MRSGGIPALARTAIKFAVKGRFASIFRALEDMASEGYSIHVTAASIEEIKPIKIDSTIAERIGRTIEENNKLNTNVMTPARSEAKAISPM
jgi:glutathione synthase/RimK-type ligase-like ATP-grasp enzyme